MKRSNTHRNFKNNAIDNALRMARGHYDDGGDVRGDSLSRSEQASADRNYSAPSRGETLSAFEGRSTPEQREYSYTGRDVSDYTGSGRGAVEQPGERAQYMAGENLAGQMVSDRFGFGSGQPYGQDVGLGGAYPMFQRSDVFGLGGLQPMTWQRARAEQALGTFTQPESEDMGAAYNPVTGAFGKYQLLPSTALRVLGQSYPELTYRQSQAQPNPGDIATGGVFGGAGQIPLSRQQQLREVLLNQDLQKDIATTLTEKNLRDLSRSGIQPTDANLYAAHFLGSGAAANVLTADPSTPLSALVSEAAINANPQLANMTAGDFKRFAQNAVVQGAAPSRATVTGQYAGSAENATPGAVITDAAVDAAKTAATTDTQQAATQKEIPLLLNASLTPALNRARIAELEKAGMTELGREYELTDAEGNVISPKEWYRQDMERQLNRPVSIDEVKSGIVTRDGQQLVNYALKDPETEIAKALITGFVPGAGLMSLLGKLGGSQVPDAVKYAREIVQTPNVTVPAGGGGGGRDQQVQQMTAAPSAPVAAPAPYTTELSAGNLALPSTTGQTAEQWAATNTGGDLSKVHARIKYVNGAPMLEYYTI